MRCYRYRYMRWYKTLVAAPMSQPCHASCSLKAIGYLNCSESECASCHHDVHYKLGAPVLKPSMEVELIVPLQVNHGKIVARIACHQFTADRSIIYPY